MRAAPAIARGGRVSVAGRMQPGARRGERAEMQLADGASAAEPVDERDFERLRAWRWQQAQGKPAYTVAANAVLEEVLRRRPRTLGDLLEIKGIGPAFCEKHGESLLAALAMPGGGDVRDERPGADLSPPVGAALA
jgi:superfamily II DNA helicase RecQ